MSLKVKVGIAAVVVRDDLHVGGPFDPEDWIIPPDPPAVSRSIKLRHLIENLCIVHKCQKPMSKALGDIEHSVVSSKL